MHGARHATAATIAAGGPFASAPDPSLPTLAATFGAAGYRTVAVSSNGLLGADSPIMAGFQTVALYDDDDPSTTRAAIEQLRAEDPRPLLLFVNLLGSHLPYVAHPAPWMTPHAAAVDPQTAPSWLQPYLSVENERPTVRLNRMAPDGGDAPVRAFSAGAFPIDENGLRLLRDIYDSEVLATDRLLNGLVSAWTTRPGDPGIVVVTADHGEHFGEQDLLDHGNGVWSAVTHVPLVVAAPGRLPSGQTVTHPTGIARIAPTLLHLAGIDGTLGPEAPLDTSANTKAPPVLSACRADPVRAARLGGRAAADAWLVRHGDWALVHIEGEAPHLYAVDTDPLMLHDIAAQHPDEVARLAMWLDAPRQANVPDRTAPDSTETALQQLGYLDRPPTAKP